MMDTLQPLRINSLAALKWTCAALAAWWIHDLPLAMRTLILLMIWDYATGLAAAFRARALSSRIGMNGLITKLSIVCFLLFGHWLEGIAGHELGAEVFGAFGFAVNEIISIVENFGELGVPLGERTRMIISTAKRLWVKPN